ncbi:MAG: Fe-S cluster assembly protein SufD, partial [Pseudomonadota bacterium]
MALPKAKHDATEARLATLAMPVEGGWTKTARDAALARVRQMGLPSRRDEYWKFTRPESLVNVEAPKAAVFDTTDELPMFDGTDRLKIVFVDGVFDPDASDDLTL